MREGVFLTIEGSEGVGKTTAIQYISDYLTKAQQAFVLTREPGGTEIAEEIRKILLHPQTSEKILPETELLLMFASRAQHIANIILPALHAGKWVVSDRFVDASYAYQGSGRQQDQNHIRFLDKWLVNGLKPQRTILLDAPADVGLARAKNRGAHDRIESEKVDFFERVRAAYLVRAQEDSTRFRVIDATQSVVSVQTELKKILDELLRHT